jgi:hypothetical protein
MKYWTTVESSFEVAGRGCWIVPDVSKWSMDIQVGSKDKIQLRSPAGRVLDTCIDSVEFATKLTGPFLVIGLPTAIRKEDVPDGTEIWLREEPGP